MKIELARHRADLPTMPLGIARLPVDTRGFPVPWFVQWFKDGVRTAAGAGEPDFRVIDPHKFTRAIKHRRCWCCGGPLGVHRAFVIGPMCAVTRTTSEPPNHLACAEFAAKACPFLTRPRMRRNDKNLPPEGVMAGIPIDRNPGVACIWVTRSHKVFRAHAGGPGLLFNVGEPERVLWYAEGREATRDQVMASIESGLPILRKIAEKDGGEAVVELEFLVAKTMSLLPSLAHVTTAGMEP